MTSRKRQYYSNGKQISDFQGLEIGEEVTEKGQYKEFLGCIRMVMIDTRLYVFVKALELYITRSHF